MPRAVCPVCRKKTDVSLSEAVIGNRLHCPHCHALLEVVEEDPIELMEVFDDDFSWEDELEEER
ncbi:MAG: hypothetical protein XD60_1784 [Acetothermia bacterium 64_32]|nr:MAG: hypothetical protein XD60_1784 [Acetothermia bacterium 64_32]MBC7098155.1 hypothetical protein [Candidatus Bipolaricaulota bacterium]HAF71445.1 hypothetical protein [Candidatus Acetothermia bacterium]